MKPSGVVLCCVLVAENVECRRWILSDDKWGYCSLVTSEGHRLRESRRPRVPCFYIQHSRRAEKIFSARRVEVSFFDEVFARSQENERAVTALVLRA